ncbi:hypothetical protein P8629_02415 [Hydrogenovibrio sp. 3SP14C1]|uniref:hypothetical protein n=1 Tax=Hydrogenovibrio sp. 3SP14C1 TaxID=3038774 RepID=UPI0024165F14|nr:hypothetical protein [Hydrogenovibrio sp. 3SP14C1]MDG4811849.1 hypothetical protein [Hydrogenovibrio sp. 3SP14C1]
MDSPFISASLLNTLGLPIWQSRPGHFLQSQTSQESVTPSYETSNEGVGEIVQVEEVSNPLDYVAASDSEHQRTFVFLGAGLNAVWQNEERSEWQLFLNILSAFKLSEDQVRFFDTSQLVTEETIFATLDEIIELGVEQVFAYDEAGPLLQELNEGAQIIVIPSLDEMLSSGRAKRDFYHLMMAQLA